MNTNTPAAAEGPKYFVDIEGHEFPWPNSNITAADIAKLGGWALADGVIEIDGDNNEHPLAPDAIVELKPGHGFSKKVKWKRGDDLYQQRLDLELAALKHQYPEIRREEGWFLIPSYNTLAPGWSRSATPVAFLAPVGYPGAQPYGIYVPAGMTFNGAKPINYTEPAAATPPFGGQWGMFSWSPEDAWLPTAEVLGGSNLFQFAASIAKRFKEGL